MFDRSASRRTFMTGAFAATAALSLPAQRAAAAPHKPHVVLLGDSILLNAMDGSLTSGVGLQLKIAPVDTTHFVVSAGGNDALHYSGIIGEKAASVAEAMDKLADIRERFMADYRAMLDDVTSRGLPVAVCTIYDARFPDAKQRRLSSLGLTIFNDCITREASARGLALIDLRLILTDDSDLANPIEPSVSGGGKIASAIAAFAAEYDASKGRCEVFTGSDAKS